LVSHHYFFNKCSLSFICGQAINTGEKFVHFVKLIVMLSDQILLLLLQQLLLLST